MSIGGSFDVVDSYLPLSQLGARIVELIHEISRGEDTIEDLIGVKL